MKGKSGQIMVGKPSQFVDIIFTEDYGKYKKGKQIKTTYKWLDFYTKEGVAEQIFPFVSEQQVMKKLLNREEE